MSRSLKQCDWTSTDRLLWRSQLATPLYRSLCMMRVRDGKQLLAQTKTMIPDPFSDLVNAEDTISGVSGNDYVPVDTSLDTGNRQANAWFDYKASVSNSISSTTTRPGTSQTTTVGAIQKT